MKLNLIPFEQIKDSITHYLYAGDTGFAITKDNQVYQCAGCSASQEYYILLPKDPESTPLFSHPSWTQHYIFDDDEQHQIAVKLGYE